MTNRERAKQLTKIRTEEYWRQMITNGVDPLVDMTEKILDEAELRGFEQAKKMAAEIIKFHDGTPTGCGCAGNCSCQCHEYEMRQEHLRLKEEILAMKFADAQKMEDK